VHTNTHSLPHSPRRTYTRTGTYICKQTYKHTLVNTYTHRTLGRGSFCTKVAVHLVNQTRYYSPLQVFVWVSCQCNFSHALQISECASSMQSARGEISLLPCGEGEIICSRLKKLENVSRQTGKRNSERNDISSKAFARYIIGSLKARSIWYCSKLFGWLRPCTQRMKEKENDHGRTTAQHTWSKLKNRCEM